MAEAQAGPISMPGVGASATPPPARNELVRIEQARPVAPLAMTPPVVASNDKLAKATPLPKGKKGKKTKARISGAGSDPRAGSGRSEQTRASRHTHDGCVSPCSSQRAKPSCRHARPGV